MNTSAANPQADVTTRIAAELGVKSWQVDAAIGLLDAGSTVPFIARYRKEVTGTLDDAQLRTLEERLRYLRELEERRAAVIAAIAEQGKLTDALAASLAAAATKTELEDLYLPYKTKRRTRAQIAREAGLEPLADALLADPGMDPVTAAAAYVSADGTEGDTAVATADDALAGARAIVIERASQDVELVTELRERLWKAGVIRSSVATGAGDAAAKFADYHDFAELVHKLPSHRILALLRGERDGALSLDLGEADPADAEALAAARAGYEAAVARAVGANAPAGTPAADWQARTVRLAWKGRILSRLESDVRSRLFEAAEEQAIGVFAANLRDVLLAAPAGNRAVLGLDPGLRTGVKVAVVNETGRVVETATIYPHAGGKSGAKWEASLAVLEELAAKHATTLIAVGNGTASRETDRLAGEALARLAKNPAYAAATASGPKPAKVIVSEAGASVYSASALASAELPDLDVSLRGAASIARRLQDPLAELVKIEPKSIGVGQYQHDLTAAKLDRTLDAVVEDCVTAVGVDVNTASPALLARVAGVGPTLGKNIVAYRDTNGPFASRRELKKVPRLGEKAFEQCAGFLRVTGGAPLDASAVHPEAYGLAERILAAAGLSKDDVGTSAASVAALDPAQFVDDRFGVPTVRDVMAELARPGRDPRGEFVTATLKEGVETIADLVPGMILEGTVSNVAAFGAFVDLGVHQDGLVHVSAMSNRFVADPREVVTSGAIVKVKVLEVDAQRKRISLTLRLDDPLPGESTHDDAAPAARAEQRRGGGPRGAGNGRGDRNRGKGRSDGGSGKPAPKHAGGAVQRQGGDDTAMGEALRRAGLA
ncbi:Tex family protein [Zhihengliuella halotolerans]|uniref:Tex family protein n=1 Tax=Zhihengliuella halotolerans TaxID=370736 RepID=UPI000C7FC0D6|nr:Tex family protein [Zhihengliuella halotolerans]